jgi:gluconate 2-dehydrogenase gamma chain
MFRDSNRRQFLLQSVTGFSAVWISAQWPALVAAAEHGRFEAQSAAQKRLEFFSPAEAIEIDAISSRVIPTDETPGAHEAGVVYFIDRALTTFAADAQAIFRDGLPELQARVAEVFPQIAKFSGATPEQQDQILRSFDKQAPKRAVRAFRPSPGAETFFETLRTFTIAAFLLDPDTRGNPEGIGWKLIGREREHMFQPPFGYYDKDYPGWQPPATHEAEKDGAKK